MPVTLTQIAEASNVSVSLVSRLVRNDPKLRVSEETRQRVLAVKAQLDGEPSPIRPLPGPGRQRPRTFMVSMDTQYRQTPAFGVDSFHLYRLVEEIEMQLGELGHTLAINYCTDDARKKQVEQLVDTDYPIDGVIYLLGDIEQAHQEAILRHRFPHVVFHPAGHYEQLQTVRPLKEESFRLLVNHLLNLGHERIAYVGCPRRRYPWFAEAMIYAGQSISDEGLCRLDADGPMGIWSDWRGLGNRAFGAWFDEHRDWTAVVAENDFVALGVIDALETRGVRVGEDVSVASYGNVEPPVTGEEAAILTTIDEQVPTITRRIIAMLLDQLDRPRDYGTHEVVLGKLVIRRSTGPRP